MQVTLSNNSWHSKLYKWANGHEPNHWSLCPYFWSVFFIIIFSPIIALKKLLFGTVEFIIKPAIYAIAYKKDNKGRITETKFSKNVSKYGNKFFKIAGKILTVLYVLFVILTVVSMVVVLIMHSGFWGGLQIIGIWLLKLTGLLTLLFLIIWFFHSDTFEMIKGMLYSIKNKACPKINWRKK